MAEFDYEYSDILMELIAEAIACAPQSWHQGTLFIDSDGTTIHYELTNDVEGGEANITEYLQDLCENLYTTFRNNDEPWSAVVIHFYQDGDFWMFNSEYTFHKNLKGGA
ncbi:MAG: hypothetical protein H6623_04265 [Bdellovibrionaceae bacterium]|nr:hypothetical protein [Pseudobdellovibrionaceae bacterium]